MRLPVVAVAAFSLLPVGDPAHARTEAGEGRSVDRHAEWADPGAGHRRAARAARRAAAASARRHMIRRGDDRGVARPFGTEASAAGFHGLFPGDERYPAVRGGRGGFTRAEPAQTRRHRTAARRDRIGAPLDGMISRHAQINGVPESLVRRVVMRESGGNARAVGRGGTMGLMQIKTATARAMGYGGSASGLLDPEVNLTYAVRYLAGAYRVAGGDHDRAVSHYARGYHYAAKRAGFSAYRGPDRAGAYAAF